jgi:ABC-type antimicrobial peptide transport system permease subunit
MKLTPIYMLSNYFKVALRVMFRNKAFTAINVSGLMLGITGALLLGLWIIQELSFEQFHTNKDRLYMAWNRASENGQIVCWETTPRVLAPTLETEFSFVDKAVSYASWGTTHLFTVGEKRMLKTSGIFTDPALLTMLSFPLLEGDPTHALRAPNSIVITAKFAKQLFDEKSAYGETVTISQSSRRFDFTVTGVLKDIPPNSDFNFEYLIPFGFLESLGEKDRNWGNNSVTTLVMLKEGSDVSDVNDQIRDIEKKNYAEGQHIEIFLYPLTQMRLYSRFENGVAVGGRIEVMRMLGMLGALLVAVACINFVNLSTARAQRRAKEVAVRKVTGAVRSSLIVQFFCESILIAAVAAVFSIVAAYMVLPMFNALIHQQLSIDFLNAQFWYGAVAFVFIIGVLAGGYPALYLSSFRPAAILKGATLSGRSFLRTMLVVLQFGFAVTLIVSTLVIREQTIFVQNRDAGYSRDNLIYIPLTGDLKKNFGAFRNELEQSGTTRSITKTSAPLTEQWSSTTGMQWKGKNPEERTDFERIYVDSDFAATSGITVLNGRDMDLRKFPTDSSAALINQTALKVMGFDDPIGEIIFDNGHEWHVVGVVKDFVFTSPFQKIEPIVLFGAKPKNAFNIVYLKLNAENAVEENLASLSSLAKKYNPDYPFDYSFADVEYQRKFDNMQATLMITTLFSSIAIFIACLGLLGLTTYMIESKVKEIGIRKVMGGSMLSITRLLSYTALKPIFISIILFTPLSWLAMNWWLQTFAFRVQLNGWVFLTSGLMLVFIASLTVALNTFRAANANPVESLRNE